MNNLTVLIIVMAASSAVLLISISWLKQLLRQQKVMNKKHERRVRALQYNVQDMLELNTEIETTIEQTRQRIERNNRAILILLILMILVAAYMAYGED